MEHRHKKKQRGKQKNDSDDCCKSKSMLLSASFALFKRQGYTSHQDGEQENDEYTQLNI